MNQQTEINFHPLPDELTGLTPQEIKLYAQLRTGALRTDNIRDETELIHYSRRFTSIRRALKEHGWTVSKRYCGYPGNRVYEYFLEQLTTEREAA